MAKGFLFIKVSNDPMLGEGYRLRRHKKKGKEKKKNLAGIQGKG